MARRIYEELQQLVERQGGNMTYERAGAHGGVWTIVLHGRTREFLSNGAGFPELDRLYVPKVAEPAHYSHYTNELVSTAFEKLLTLLHGGTPAGTPAITANPPLAPNIPSIDLTALPIADAADYVSRVAASRHLPERNMEDLVKELLVRLGHSPSSIVFQVGHIDVLVRDGNGTPYLVVEVKRNLKSKPERDSALRQAFDYANRNGAPMVVITDADLYEIYDRRCGLDHASTLKAKFQVTRFQASDRQALELLRAT